VGEVREAKATAVVANLKVDRLAKALDRVLGRGRRFYVGSGLGAKRILGDADAFDSAPFVYGTARFLIGVAF